jgi:hypothetical protein
LPGGGNYQVCGVRDLKPAVFAQNLPANSLIRFADDFGGVTNLYQGFDVNLDARFRNGAFLKAGIAATARTFDNCNLVAAGIDALANNAATAQGAEEYPDGSTSCHRDYAYRPDFKASGSYTLPWDVQLAGTFQFSRGIQKRRRRSEPDRLVGDPERDSGDDRRARVDQRGHQDGQPDPRGFRTTASTTSNSSISSWRSASPLTRSALRVDFDLYNSVSTAAGPTR